MFSWVVNNYFSKVKKLFTFNISKPVEFRKILRLSAEKFIEIRF